MADSNISILQSDATAENIDTRTEGSNSQHRQVVVIGAPDTNANVVNVINEDPGSSSTLQGLVVRLAGTATNIGAGTAGTPAGGVVSVQGVTSGQAIPISGTVTGITNSVNIYLGATAGTIAANIGTIAGTAAVFFSPANPKVNLGTDVLNVSTTAILPSTASGSTSTAGGSGVNTVVSTEASRNIKVYAYSITTTGIVSISPRFTTGGSGGATELWRVALQAISGSNTGANLAVQPPGYLFAAGTGNTLALFLDSATLVHYSVGYFKESS